jgi:23S rRNA (pseudouridine1915-N3)-methyltransferase
MNISIICASKVKSESPVGKLVSEYQKRLTSLNLSIVEFDEKNLSKEKINEKIFSLIKPNSYKILLDEKGKSLSTLQLKNLITDSYSKNQKNISFLIAGSDGFTAECKSKADYILSLSSLTFPHQIARMLLVEQIYRVQSLINNHPYHRE